MTRLNMTVEGETEQTFVVRVLKDYLARHGVFTGKPRLTALAKKKGRVHRGGMGAYEAFKNDIVTWLHEDRNADIYFTTMIDLYGLPRSFPGYDKAAGIGDPYHRVAELENALSKGIGDGRFIPYIQLHEFEALLLSDPDKFSAYYTGHAPQIERLKELCVGCDSPERIDDGEQSAPSKRIGHVIPRYLGEKRTAGPIIAEQIGIETIRQKCPHFDQWLRKLEALGTSGANKST